MFPEVAHSPQAAAAARKAAGGPAHALQDMKSSINAAPQGQELRGPTHPDAATIAIQAVESRACSESEDHHRADLASARATPKPQEDLPLSWHWSGQSGSATLEDLP